MFPCFSFPLRWQVVSLYFVFLFWVTKPEEQEETAASASASAPTTTTTDAVAAPPTDAALVATATATAPAPLAVTKETISYALTAACALCLSGELLSKLAFGGRVSAMYVLSVWLSGLTPGSDVIFSV